MLTLEEVYSSTVLEKDEHKKSRQYKKLSPKMKDAIDQIFGIMDSKPSDFLNTFEKTIKDVSKKFKVAEKDLMHYFEKEMLAIQENRRSFATRTLRDTVVNAAGAGGTVTILVNIDDDTTTTNAILDASALDGHANGAKLHISRIWWGLVQGTTNDDTGHVAIIEQGDSDVTLIDLAGSGHYDGSAGLIKSNATNTGATSGDMEMSCQGTSGFVLIEFKKDENYTS